MTVKDFAKGAAIEASAIVDLEHEGGPKKKTTYFVVPAGGGTATELVAGEDPSWSPNSRTLVYARRSSGGSRALSLLDVPTKQYKDVSRITGSNSQPSWAK